MNNVQMQIIIHLNKYWSKYPMLRFNQLLYSLQIEYALNNNTHGNDGNSADLFYVSDEKFLEFLKQKVKEIE